MIVPATNTASPFPPNLLGPMPPVPYIEARYWKRGVRRKSVLWVVLHCTDTYEAADRAEKCASYFHNMAPDLPMEKWASAHYAVDQNSIMQMVREECIAYGAAGVNPLAIHIEHGGVDEQTREQWLDAGSLPMLDLSAQLVGEEIAPFWDIPIQFVNAADILKHKPGVTTHFEVNKAFGRGKHKDPGPSFPVDLYLGRVQAYRQRKFLNAEAVS